MTSNDLNKLIDNAESQVKQQELNTGPVRRRFSGDIIKDIAAVAILLVAGVTMINSSTSSSTAPPPADEVEDDIVTLLQQAKDQVDSNTVNGQLPPVLPSAALAAIVSYQVSGSGYNLTTELHGVRVTMDASGKMTKSHNPR